MSAASMVDAKLAREAAAPAAPAAPPGGAPPPAPVGVDTNVVNQLTRWIPTETITLYVAWLAILGPLAVTGTQKLCDLSYVSRVWSTVAFAVVSAVIVLGLTKVKAAQNNKAFTWPIFEMIISPIAFTAWALALPETPLQAFCGYNTAIGAFIVIATTIAVSVVASAFNFSPHFAQTPTD
jgi:hypothetical protein